MSNVDMSLDDLINKDDNRRPATRGRASGNQARQRARPYPTQGRAPGGSRRAPGGRNNSRQSDDSSTTLKVSSSTIPNKVAGAICNVIRESSGATPGVMATGPHAINQAIKGIAIARKYLLEENIDIIVTPQFEEDLRSGSNVVFQLKRSNPINREPTEDDLSAKDKTDCFKLAGAIAGRIRDGEQVACTTKGAVPVLVVVKAIALAQDYVRDENIDLKFAVQFRDLEAPELRGAPSTYLHFAILPRNS